MNKQFAQMTNARLKLTIHVSATLIWYRRAGVGWALDRSPLLFSERNGYGKFRQLPFGWRLKRLNRVQ